MKIQVLFLFLLITFSAKAQDWKPGCYYDTTGVKHVGLVKISTLDNETSYGSIKTIDCDVFKFKVNAHSKAQELYAYDVQSIIADADSFVVQHTFRMNRHGVIKKDTNGTPYRHVIFFQVQLDRSEIKIYSKEQFGTAGFGGMTMTMLDYYYGKNPDNIEYFSDDNFAKVMSDVMKDAPDIVAKIKNEDFSMRKIGKLLKAYKIEKGLPLSSE